MHLLASAGADALLHPSRAIRRRAEVWPSPHGSPVAGNPDPGDHARLADV